METPGATKGTRIGRYLINGNPVALARARFGDGRVYDSQKNIKVITTITLQGQHNDAPFFEGPLSLNLSFYLPIVSARKIKLNTLPHTQAPDLDNLIKYIADVASGILYKDDRTIACIVARKYYSTNPRTEIIISQIAEDSW